MGSATSTVTNRDETKHPFTSAGETDLKDKVMNTGATGMEMAKDAASSVAHAMGEAGSAVGDKANEATSAVGGGMKSLAGTIRRHTPHEGMLGTASASVADSLESGGRYLQEEGLRGMADDVTNLIPRNPISALLIGIGIGFLLAKVTTRGTHGK
jgi:hypothetical protein